jgi:hypothetical protein
MTLEELFDQAAGDLTKYPGSVITVQASVTVTRWGAGLTQPAAYDNLLVTQNATGTLTYQPGYMTFNKVETFVPASFSGQVTSGSFGADQGGKEVSYSFTLFVNVLAATPVEPNGVVITLTNPALKPPPTESFSNLFTTAGGSYVFFQQAADTGSLNKYISVQLDGYTVRAPKTSPIVPSLVGLIFGGVGVDGGGLIVVGGVPGPVPPLGPIPAGAIDAATRDLLIGIAMDEMAKSISDRQSRTAVRSAILSETSYSVGRMTESVSDHAKIESAMKKEANPSFQK